MPKTIAALLMANFFLYGVSCGIDFQRKADEVSESVREAKKVLKEKSKEPIRKLKEEFEMYITFQLDNVRVLIPNDYEKLIDVYSEEYGDIIEELVTDKSGFYAMKVKDLIRAIREGFTVVDQEGIEL